MSTESLARNVESLPPNVESLPPNVKIQYIFVKFGWVIITRSWKALISHKVCTLKPLIHKDLQTLDNFELFWLWDRARAFIYEWWCVQIAAFQVFYVFHLHALFFAFSFHAPTFRNRIYFSLFNSLIHSPPRRGAKRWKSSSEVHRFMIVRSHFGSRLWYFGMDCDNLDSMLCDE